MSIFLLQAFSSAPVPAIGTTAAPSTLGFGARKAGAPRQRHRKVLRDNMDLVLAKCAIKRIMYRGGVKRMSGLVPEEIRESLRVSALKMLK